MEHKGKTFVSVLIIISFFFSFIFCFDSPNIFTNIMLIGADILFWGGLRVHPHHKGASAGVCVVWLAGLHKS